MVHRVKKVKRMPVHNGRRFTLEAAVENTWTKVLTRFGVPSLLTVTIWLGAQYWSEFKEEFQRLHAEDVKIRGEAIAAQKENADARQKIIETITGIQQTTVQQQTLIQQMSKEIDDNQDNLDHRLEKLEDRFMLPNGR